MSPMPPGKAFPSSQAMKSTHSWESAKAMLQAVVGHSPFAIDEIEVVRAVLDARLHGAYSIGVSDRIATANEHRRECGE